MNDTPIDLDPVGLRGLAHPIRIRLLDALRESGPATATVLAGRLGLSSGSTSHHLRQLARYGFVEEDTGRGTGRDRWWRAAHRGTNLAAEVGRQSLPEAEGYLRAVAIADFRRVDGFLGDLPSVPPEWDESWTISTARLRLTAAESAALRRRVEALIAEYPSYDPDDVPDGESRCVVLQWQHFPLPEGS